MTANMQSIISMDNNTHAILTYKNNGEKWRRINGNRHDLFLKIILASWTDGLTLLTFDSRSAVLKAGWGWREKTTETMKKIPVCHLSVSL
ncbi:hypothetical protein COCON_G00198650 [Conger conger]|uniref:Uncharacterized protein n=1 Tax=Conger conger TaxID=82655 RepID=A0A9Q1D1L9_CONCO|nr:hypothetical protein COCON_G00198650 [Conger conger]